MNSHTLSRRKLLAATGTTALATLALGGRATAALIQESPHERLQESSQENPMALLDGMLSEEELAAARRILAPLQPRLLQPDLVWQWRRELGQQIARGVRAVAITRWDKAVVLRGLAREAALPLRQDRIGKSLFRTEIG